MAKFSTELNILINFGRRHHEEHFFEIILNLDQLFRRRSFKDISYLQLWRPFCSVLPNHLCNYGGGPYAEYFCETVLNLEQWLKRKCCLKTFPI